MKFGVFLPISGRAAGPTALMQAARSAEAQGFDSVWAADRIIIPWEITTPYNYSSSQQFIVPPDRPFLEPLTCLAFLAGCTEKILLGMSVMVLPYRPPIYSAKVATTIDTLSKGRLILGIGIGWMVEEFEALGLPFKDRAAVSAEQVQIFKRLWEDERPRFEGRHYRFGELAFYPKPVQKPRIPLWVGGEGEHAQRRAGRYGDAWFPYFVKITPQELAARFENVQRSAKEAGRDPADLRLNCCLPVELTKEAVPQEPDRLNGNPEQVSKALQGFQKVGVQHIALQFMVPHLPERLEQIDRFAREVIPAFRDSKP